MCRLALAVTDAGPHLACSVALGGPLVLPSAPPAGSHRAIPRGATELGAIQPVGSRIKSRLARIPNKLRKLKSASAKRGHRGTRRRSHKITRPRYGSCVGTLAIRAYTACTSPLDHSTSRLVSIHVLLGFYLVLQLWSRLNNWNVAWSAARSLKCQHISPPLHRSRRRSRAQIPLPLQDGRRQPDCPTSSTVSLIRQYTRPGPKSGVGRMLITLLKLIRCQLSHGVRAHDWNRYVKRSFKRACQRAIKHGQASYKGRTLTVKNAP